MAIYVSLLRGINVGGHKKIRMAELRALYASCGFDPVESYIQSGNVVFGAGKGSAASVTRTLEKAIAGEFGFDVRVVLRTGAEMESLVAANPFLEEGADPTKLHVTFLAGVPSPDAAEAFASYTLGPDELRLRGREAYLHCPEGLARTRFTPAVLERALGSASTTRNWRTVSKALEMVRGMVRGTTP